MPPNNQPIPPAQPQQTIAGSSPVPPKKNANSTQNSLLLSEVRDNMVIMADGSFRGVVQCESINFDLMSTAEREGVEYSYQNFLNSLNFPIQIVVRSQRIDIAPYFDKLYESRQNQDNMLLTVLMDDYINFIDVLTQEANIMNKTFYVVVPFYPQGDATKIVEQSKGFFSKILSQNTVSITKVDNFTYEKAKTEIKNRVDSVMAGLHQIGIQSFQLNTEQLAEMYYKFYNPDQAQYQPVSSYKDVATTYVMKGKNNPNGASA